MRPLAAKKILLLCLLLIFLGFQSGHAQEEGAEAVEETGEESEEGRFAAALVLGFTHIPEARTEGESTESENLFTIGIDLFYHLNERWKIGAVIDTELSKYEVDFKGDRLSREIALVTGVVAGYEILPRWGIIFGPGVEFERNKNLFIFRLGTEYAFEIGRSWELFPSLNFDFKQEFSTYSLGIGIGKRF